MNDAPPGMTPIRKVLAVLGTFVGAAAVSALLWNWWAPRCGDDCPQPRLVHMLVYLALLPSLGTMAAALMVSLGGSAAFKWRVAGVLVVIAAAVGAMVARLPAA